MIPKWLVGKELFKAMAVENRKWPIRLREMTEEERRTPVAASGGMTLPRRAWRSRDFLVQEYAVPYTPVRLTIQRTTLKADGSWMDGITWDEMQRLKAECGYGEAFAVEVYPEEQHVVNVANLRHLWLIDRPAWAWR